MYHRNEEIVARMKKQQLWPAQRAKMASRKTRELSKKTTTEGKRCRKEKNTF